MVRMPVWLYSFLVLMAPAVRAQKDVNLAEHDAKPYYFGFTVGSNISRYQATLHNYYLSNDSITFVQPLRSAGFNIGFLSTARLSDHFQVRINPQLIFTSRSIFYRLKYAEAGQMDITKKIESIIVSFPLQVKMQSDRIGNLRFYMLAGIKADIDINGSVRERKNEALIKIKKYDCGPELGLGLNFFFPGFILSPEIKISNGTSNILTRDAHFKYSAVFDKIQSRMIVFCIHVEG